MDGVMGLRQVPSDVGGATSAAVGEQWKRLERERYAKAAERTSQILAEAEQWLCRYPEFVTTDGTACYLAINCLMRLRSLQGLGRVTREMVRGDWERELRAPQRQWYVQEFLPQIKGDER